MIKLIVTLPEESAKHILENVDAFKESMASLGIPIDQVITLGELYVCTCAGCGAKVLTNIEQFLLCSKCE